MILQKRNKKILQDRVVFIDNIIDIYLEHLQIFQEIRINIINYSYLRHVKIEEKLIKVVKIIINLNII